MGEWRQLRPSRATCSFFIAVISTEAQSRNGQESITVSISLFGRSIHSRSNGFLIFENANLKTTLNLLYFFSKVLHIKLSSGLNSSSLAVHCPPLESKIVLLEPSATWQSALSRRRKKTYCTIIRPMSGNQAKIFVGKMLI